MNNDQLFYGILVSTSLILLLTLVCGGLSVALANAHQRIRKYVSKFD